MLDATRRFADCQLIPLVLDLDGDGCHTRAPISWHLPLRVLYAWRRHDALPDAEYWLILERAERQKLAPSSEADAIWMRRAGDSIRPEVGARGTARSVSVA